MSRTRQLVLALAAMGLAVLLASGVALAATFTGTEGDDTIDGSSSADWMRGHAGNDTISGKDGDDDIGGERGDDTISGDGGGDTIVGGPGNDTLRAGPLEETNVDTIRGEDGDDTIYAANLPASRDAIYCGAGTDKVTVDSLDEVSSGCEKVERIQEEEPQLADGTYQLVPDPSSECDLGEGSFTIGSDTETGERGVEVQFGDKVDSPGSAPEACDVKIDYESPVATQGETSAQSSSTRSYKGEKPPQNEIDEAKEQEQSIAAEGETTGPSSGSTSGDITAQATWYKSNYYVRLRTRDPADSILNSTYHRLSWWYNGYDVDYSGRYGTCYAANPSDFNTHWYVSYCRYVGSMWYSYDSSRSWIGSEAEGRYWNRDFPDDKLPLSYTYAYHKTRIWGYDNGYAGHRRTWNFSGDFYWLLDLTYAKGYL